MVWGIICGHVIFSYAPTSMGTLVFWTTQTLSRHSLMNQGFCLLGNCAYTVLKNRLGFNQFTLLMWNVQCECSTYPQELDCCWVVWLSIPKNAAFNILFYSIPFLINSVHKWHSCRLTHGHSHMYAHTNTDHIDCRTHASVWEGHLLQSLDVNGLRPFVIYNVVLSRVIDSATSLCLSCQDAFTLVPL